MNSLNKLVSFTLRKTWKYNFISIRPFFNSLNLGIDSFLRRRKEFQNINKWRLKEFKSKMIEASAEGNNFTVFSQDVLKMIYLAENREDLKIVNNLLKKFTTNKLIRSVGYKGGADVMRLHYILNEPEEAMNIIQEPVLRKEFSSTISQIILLDLLFENGLYREVIEIYKVVCNLVPRTSPNYIQLLIYFASCYKLDTSDAFSSAYNTWQNLLHCKFWPRKRLRHFFSALSVNQNELFCAMEVLPLSSSDILTENLKCLILVKSKRFLDVFECLNEVLESGSQNKLIFKEVVKAIEEEVGSSSEDNIKKFHNLKENLFLKKLIVDETIESSLFSDLGDLMKKPVNSEAESISLGKK